MSHSSEGPSAFFPHLPEGAIVHRDEDLLVVDKPAGVASQSADAELADDLPTRIRRHLGDERLYLGIHQRLDRETSGVVVFTTRKESNREVARLFEERRVEKSYVAGVSSARRPRGGRLVHELDEEEERVFVAERKGRRTRTAIASVTTLAYLAPRGLVEVLLETGRRHQIRVQLAAIGAEVAGDPLYSRDDCGAARMLLHARTLVLPFGRKARRFEVPLPLELDEWVERGGPGPRIFDRPELLDAALRRARDRRYGLAHSRGGRASTAFRLVNEGGDGLPGLAVDVYDRHLVAQFYEGEIWDVSGRKDRVLDALHRLGFDGVYAKYRPKQANVLVDTRRDDVAPKEAVRGESRPGELVVQEEAVPYGVRLGDGLSTGIFLDQRANRRRVRGASGGKRVLNLFAYTCPFSVAAAAGGAVSTTSVDAALLALEWGKKNVARVGGGEHRFVGDDVFRFLRTAEKRGERWDLALLDPPTYSSTKKSRWVAAEQYGELAVSVARLLAPGGEMLASCNHRKMSPRAFRKQILRAFEEAGITASIRDLPTPVDYPSPIGRDCHLKAVWIRLSSSPG